ncbi:Condensation domain-containing protein [Streptosporangium canum]|uniref:Condensation domain-containing protein n=1 Tax=Streptosporangium canum TaxID=324952 RepID=A0A1I3N1D8_9ACTN|nr:condensation domain-containing protein [Streptosporangium canum]SFJ02726.1 Condensation domain-containing protein [Streptosporangium canum]
MPGTLQDFVSALTPDKARLLVERVGDSERYPLSPPQLAVYTADQVTPGTTAYLNPSIIRLDGPLDTGRLVTALAGLHYRNPALRSRYGLGADGPYAVVTACGSPELEIVDVSDAADPGTEALDEARWALRPFTGLDAPPLWRAMLIREAAERHSLVLILHHLISDGWSWEILSEQLAALYAAGPVPRSEDYFRTWQRRCPVDPAAAEDIAIEVADALDAPRLAGSGDGPGPGVTLQFRLVDEDRARVEAAARATGATPMTVLLWAAGKALAELRETPRSVVLVPAAGRWDAASERAVGCYVNSLPLVLDARSTLAVTAERLRALVARQATPLSEVMRHLGDERAEAGRIMVVHNNAPAAGTSFAALTATPVHLPLADVQRDLTYSVWSRHDGIGGELQVRAGVAAAYGADRLVGEFIAVLRRLPG